MTEEKWQDVKYNIKDKFGILEEKTEAIELYADSDQPQKIGDKEIVIFESDAGKFKLEYIVKPVILDKKVHYSRRIGTSSNTEFILSETEFTRRMDAFIFRDGEWNKLDSNNFANR